jgi:uncharacterized protein (TIGR00661 family)
MQLLYGVQGTGNGHLSRARAMARALRGNGVHADFLFSGRSRGLFFDMHDFGDFRVVPGLTFASSNGQLSVLRTLLDNRYWRFVRDVFALDLSSYELVLSDFEPVSAWAGRVRGKTVVSFGHQPAFDFSVPVAGRDWRSDLVMRFFAPGTIRIGMHWGKFAAPILPPIVDLSTAPGPATANKVLVYLPFENQRRLQAVFRTVPGYEFYIYAPGNTVTDEGQLHCRPPSLAGFRADLRESAAVICNAGFELSSECLVLGKRLLVKPLVGQMEQASNALALKQLGYADTLEVVEADAIRRWLDCEKRVPRLIYPDVAAAIAAWLRSGDFHPESIELMSQRLWREVCVI